MKYQAIGITGLFFLLSIIGITSHEFWLDEAHHILLGSQSQSVCELIENCKYEGHPLLWNLILYSITHITNNIFCVQLLHVLISTGCAYLILEHAPFKLFIKVGVIFGYFMFYEYTVICRSYSLGLLLALLVLINLSKEKKNFLLLSCLLFLLCNVHLFFAVIALNLILINYSRWRTESIKDKVLSFSILCFGFTFCLLSVVPPIDHFLYQYNQSDFSSLSRLAKISWVPLKGLLPFPNFHLTNYWNSNLLLSLSKPTAFLVSLTVCLIPSLLFLRHRCSFLFFNVSLLIILLFFYVSPLMLTSRNCGFFSILLFTAYWLKYTLKQKMVISKNIFSQQFLTKITTLFFTLILVVQFFSGIIIWTFDLTRDFSNSKKTSAYINEYTSKNKCKLLLSHHSSGPAISLYCNQQLFYLESNKYGSFCEWNTNPFTNNTAILLNKIKHEVSTNGSIMLILNEPYKMEELKSYNEKYKLISKFQAEYLAAFDSATVGSENYFLYLLK